MDRIFLDANILFSAAYLENSGLGRLWQLDDVELLTSSYALEEASRNLALERPSALNRLERLTHGLTMVDSPQTVSLPASIRLDSKDRPILLAAIHAQADYLLTGDARHFGHLYGKRIERVMVLRPVRYLEQRGKS